MGRAKGPPEAKRGKGDSPLGHQRQSSPADTLFQNADLQNCERTGFCCFKPRLVIICCKSRKPDLISRNEKYILCHIFLKTSLKNLLTSYPRAWWSLGSQDPLSHPMSPCLRLTGEGPLMPKEPGGKEIRGWRALGSLDRTSCTCLGRCKTRCSGKTWSHVDKTGKKIQIFPTNMYACMYTHVYT